MGRTLSALREDRNDDQVIGDPVTDICGHHQCWSRLIGIVGLAGDAHGPDLTATRGRAHLRAPNRRRVAALRTCCQSVRSASWREASSRSCRSMACCCSRSSQRRSASSITALRSVPGFSLTCASTADTRAGSSVAPTFTRLRLVDIVSDTITDYLEDISMPPFVEDNQSGIVQASRTAPISSAGPAPITASTPPSSAPPAAPASCHVCNAARMRGRS
jgi:hypothetical protein